MKAINSRFSRILHFSRFPTNVTRTRCLDKSSKFSLIQLKDPNKAKLPNKMATRQVAVKRHTSSHEHMLFTLHKIDGSCVSF